MGGPVTCRYPSCADTFDEEDDLKEHMSEDHDYCQKCDIMCEDHTAFLCHLATSDKHTACPQCGRELGSVRAIEYHIKRDHKADQTLTCSGCNRLFKSAGDMIGHLEKGQCRNDARPQESITSSEFMDHINHKVILSRMLREDNQSAKFPDTSTLGGPGSMDSLNSNATAIGGVPLNHMDSVPEEGVGSTPALQPNRQQWPSLGTPSTQNTEGLADSVSSMSLEGPQDLERSTPKAASRFPTPQQSTRTTSMASVWSNGPSAAVMTGGQKSNSASSAFAIGLKDLENDYNQRHQVSSSTAMTSVSSPSTIGANDWNTRFWSAHSSSFNATRFWNGLLGAYECPHKDCSYTDSSKRAFFEHCLSIHKPEVYRCPTCLREKKSLQALVQHCESSSRKCNIRDTRDYAKFMDYVTGGFVDASKRNEKGEVLYQMARPQEFTDRTHEPGFW